MTTREALKELGRVALRRGADTKKLIALPYGFRDEGWQLFRRNGRYYCIDPAGKDVTAMMWAAVHRYDLAAELADDPKVKGAMESFQKLYDLELRKAQLMEELGLALTQKLICKHDPKSVKNHVVKLASEIGKNWSADKHVEEG